MFVALARLNDVGPFKTIELVVEIYYVDRMHKVNECEAYATSRLDVLWQVEVVVNLGELLVYHAEQIFLLEPDRDVSNHESGLREHLLVIILVCLDNLLHIHLIVLQIYFLLLLGELLLLLPLLLEKDVLEVNILQHLRVLDLNSGQIVADLVQSVCLDSEHRLRLNCLQLLLLKQKVFFYHHFLHFFIRTSQDVIIGLRYLLIELIPQLG